jgi:hypothetical protein
MNILELLQSKKNISIDPQVIEKMVHYYAQQVIISTSLKDYNLALKYYDLAKNMPNTVTRNEFRTSGYMINGNVFNGKDYLQLAFSTKIVTLNRPYVAKRLNDPDEVTRLKSFSESLKGAACLYVTSFELLSVRNKVYNFMPFHSAILAQLPQLTFEICSKLCIQMFTAFTFLHNRGFAHMDVKPSNICITIDGNFVLIDLESMAKFEDFTFSTENFLPTGLGFDASHMLSNRRVDFIMLAMTIHSFFRVNDGKAVTYDTLLNFFHRNDSLMDNQARGKLLNYVQGHFN